MAVGNDKMRLNLTLTKELNWLLEAMAEEDERSKNSMIITMIYEALRNSKQIRDLLYYIDSEYTDHNSYKNDKRLARIFRTFNGEEENNEKEDEEQFIHKSKEEEKIDENIGKTYGYWLILGKAEPINGRKAYLCQCTRCKEQTIKPVLWNNLSSGKTISCGCLVKDLGKERMIEQWQNEEFRDVMSGENNHNWKGGITPIRNYLRNLPIVVKWIEDAKENVNYTCELVGKQCRVETHHIKPFCELVMEAHVLNGIQIKEIVADYTEEELKLLVAYITKWHQDFSNAIVLSREVHRYFHNVFMKGKDRESSVEDIEKFKQRYLNGEFKDLLGGDLND